ncbi:MAG: enoyl-CoA hydratase/isomerase family protein [Burkholderiales bacterium]|jgi:methylglutaconyl-CoA hydratase|tara:strand:- start:17504 stop:18298 length:795 start_codon:yes stop_codon:yes gene_type:complete
MLTTIEIERQSNVAWVWLSRPDVRNAFDDVMIRELTETFVALGKDSSVKVVVLAGRGQSFCAGADLNWMKRMSEYTFEENRSDAGNLARMLDELYRLPKPTIARVNGHAFAGGMGLVSACDIAIASKETQFCLSEVRIGLIPATIGPYVVSAMGIRAARRYMMTAERFTAADAQRFGLVQEVVDIEALDDMVKTFVKHFNYGGADAHRETKALIEIIDQSALDQQLINETAIRIARVRASNEGQEGIRSFLEKRKPSWVGEDEA